MKKSYFTARLWLEFTWLRPRAFVLPALLLGPTLAMAQQAVKGTVTDEKNAALPGVTVHIKGATTAEATNADGTYSIQTTGSADVLVFTFVGMVNQEVVIGKRTSLNIKLLPDAQKLSDVVVIGYGTASRADITGAVTSIKLRSLTRACSLPRPSCCRAKWLV